MKPKLIFDFDGTIANTLDLLLEIANDLAEQYDLKKIDATIETLRGQSVKSILKKLDVPLIKVPILVKKINESLSQYIGKLKPEIGIQRVLHYFKDHHYSLNIITSNIEKNIEIFLKNNDLEIFDIIYSGSSIFGKHRVINRFLKTYNIDPKHALYIGDETRDIEAAKRSQLKIIAVTWGFNDEKILKKYKPDFLAQHPDDLIKIVESI